MRIFEYTFQPQNPRLEANDESLSQITANFVLKPTLMLIPGKKCESFLSNTNPSLFFVNMTHYLKQTGQISERKVRKKYPRSMNLSSQSKESKLAIDSGTRKT